jgi:hypothetical protein
VAVSVARSGISKRLDAGYSPGERGLWLKTKCLNREEFVVIGWTDPEGTRPFIGALLLGYYDPDGRVGKCTVALRDPANTIGSLLPDGSLDVDNDRLRPWLRGWASRDWETIGCPYATFPRSLQKDPAYIPGTDADTR